MHASKLLFRSALSLITCAGCVFFLAFLLYFISAGSIPGDSASLIHTAAALSEQRPAPSGLPVRLTIPSIYVATALESVGLTPEGRVDVPKDPANAAWFNLGLPPGEVGSAVIVGHYGPWKDAKPAVFSDLHKLQKGDKLYSEDEKGIVTTFVVRESRIYGEHDDASSVFGLNDGKAHLNLITCEGAWNSVSKSYSKRLVVFTDRE